MLSDRVGLRNYPVRVYTRTHYIHCNEGESLDFPTFFIFLGDSMRESTYQGKLIKKLERMFPGCIIFKNDPAVNQGYPDLTILYRDRWGMLEVKMEDGSPVQPNQEYYVEKFDDMSFAAFINPGNEERVLNDLQHAFGVDRQARVS